MRIPAHRYLAGTPIRLERAPRDIGMAGVGRPAAAIGEGARPVKVSLACPVPPPMEDFLRRAERMAGPPAAGRHGDLDITHWPYTRRNPVAACSAHERGINEARIAAEAAELAARTAACNDPPPF